jgi:hypothetical protein
VGLPGCGGSGGSAAPGAAITRNPVRVGLYDCEAWRQAGHRERLDAVDAIEAFAGGPSDSPGGHGNTLPDEDAYTLFDSYCKQGFATKFKLYKLYTRAAAFHNINQNEQ